jgi:hypothetical protein
VIDAESADKEEKYSVNLKYSSVRFLKFIQRNAYEGIFKVAAAVWIDL